MIKKSGDRHTCGLSTVGTCKIDCCKLNGETKSA